MFNDFRKICKILFSLAKRLKSQEKQCPRDVENRILDFLNEFDRVFPDVPYFNKLHFLMCHVPEFVERFGCLGLLSGESHESVHARFSRTKAIVNRMASTRQKYNTLFARTSVDLKEGIVPVKTLLQKRMSGKKRGPYNVTRSSKKQDDVAFSRQNFCDTVNVDGEDFLVLPCGMGRINAKGKELYVYVTQGRAPVDWVTSFEGILSASKIEQAKFATY